MVAIPPRHHLVWLNGAGWRDSVKNLNKGLQDTVADWFGYGLPAVARRWTQGELDQGIPLGIPLPPQRGRLRIALSVPAGAVREIRPPLTLRQVIPSAPASWRPPLLELDADFRKAGLSLRVYGSLAWQHITRQEYITDRSDVDLLLQPKDRDQLTLVMNLLQAWEQQIGLRADGEILLPDGTAVAWRELLRAPNRVLVKSTQRLMLRPIAAVFGAFET